jgi:hypothetical protein
MTKRRKKRRLTGKSGAAGRIYGKGGKGAAFMSHEVIFKFYTMNLKNLDIWWRR